MANVDIAANFDMSKQTTTIKSDAANEADVQQSAGFSMCSVHPGTWAARSTFVLCLRCGTEARDCPGCQADRMAQEWMAQEWNKEVQSLGRLVQAPWTPGEIRESRKLTSPGSQPHNGSPLVLIPFSSLFLWRWRKSLRGAAAGC